MQHPVVGSRLKAAIIRFQVINPPLPLQRIRPRHINCNSPKSPVDNIEEIAIGLTGQTPVQFRILHLKLGRNTRAVLIAHIAKRMMPHCLVVAPKSAKHVRDFRVPLQNNTVCLNAEHTILGKQRKYVIKLLAIYRRKIAPDQINPQGVGHGEGSGLGADPRQHAINSSRIKAPDILRPAPYVVARQQPAGLHIV